jgi:hypothetical protein
MRAAVLPFDQEVLGAAERDIRRVGEGLACDQAHWGKAPRQLFEDYFQLKPRQRSAEAVVDAKPECEMLARMLAMNIEPLSAGEFVFVTIC